MEGILMRPSKQKGCHPVTLPLFCKQDKGCTLELVLSQIAMSLTLNLRQIHTDLPICNRPSKELPCNLPILREMWHWILIWLDVCNSMQF